MVDTLAVEPSDEALVTRTVAGDFRAFESIVRRHRDAVYRVAARIVGSTRADDVAQETFLRAFHRLHQFRSESPFRAWLLRITHNAALTTLARDRPALGGDDDAATSEHRRDHARTPAEELEIGERRERLQMKLLEIQPDHRAVLVLRDLEGLSYREIADVTGAPLGTVKGRLHRARRELVDVLRNNTYDWELPQ